MANTVVGFFKNRSEAEDAVTQLTNSGFDNDDIDVSYGRSTGSATTNEMNETDHEREHHKGNAISRFFNSLFGDDSDDARRYTEAGNRADSIVTVHASTTERAEEAANILDASGAMDIDEGSLTDQTYEDTRRVSADHSTTRSEGSISAGLTESDLAAAGVTSTQISEAEAEAERYGSFDLATTGGTAPGITGPPTTGDLTTAGDPDEFVNRESSIQQDDINDQRTKTFKNPSPEYNDVDEQLRTQREDREQLNNWGTAANTNENMKADEHPETSRMTASTDADNDDYTRAGSRDDLSGTDYAENARRELRNRQDESQRIDVVKEDLNVGKRTVETGGLRVRSRIVERPVEQHLRLREENLRLHREPVNRPATEDEIKSFKDTDIELTERAEVPVVNKEARVVEEISVSRDVNERNETIRDTVRETQVDIDDNTTRNDNLR